MSRIPAILVVDDSEDHRFITLTELKRLQPASTVRLEEASGGEDAFRKLPKILGDASFVLVLTDYRMPTMNGIDLLRAIRQRYPPAKVRVVVYSSTDQGVIEESRSAGADEFLVKPMELAEFRARLKAILQRWLEPTKASVADSAARRSA